jgi:formylglycine-generating enzyme required for sulfatase activity
LTGAPPFRANSLYELLQAHHAIDAAPLNLARPEVPLELAAIVAKMMAKQPARRFQTPNAVAEALKAFVKVGSEQAKTSRADVFQPRPGRVEDPTRQNGPPPVRASAGRGSTPAAARHHPETAGSVSPAWQRLITIDEAGDPIETVKPRPAQPARALDQPPVHQPRWLWPSVAASVLLVGLLAVWGVPLANEGANSNIELAKLQAWQDVRVIDHSSHSTDLSSSPGPVAQAIPSEPAKPPHTEKKRETARARASKDGSTPKREPAKPVEVARKRDPTPGPVPPNGANRIGMKFVRIEPGQYRMGSGRDRVNQLLRLYPGTKSGDWWNGEQPQHFVTITLPFLLGVYEVTQGQYKAVMGENPSRFKGSDYLPVEQVSWMDAVKFCNKLSEQSAQKPYYGIERDEVTVAGGVGYRLPTEAEWEYACRSGTATLYPFGDDPGALGEHAWNIANSGKATQPVGQKRANPWGLHDLMGNVWEWCADWYDAHYYGSYPAADPPGARRTSHKVIRGGAWECFPGFCRPGFRGTWVPRDRADFLGFRVAAFQA